MQANRHYYYQYYGLLLLSLLSTTQAAPNSLRHVPWGVGDVLDVHARVGWVGCAIVLLNPWIIKMAHALFLSGKERHNCIYSRGRFSRVTCFMGAHSPRTLRVASFSSRYTHGD